MTSEEADAERPESADESGDLDGSAVSDDVADDGSDGEGSDGDSSDEPSKSEASKAQRKHLPVWQETAILLVVALGLAIVIKALFVQAFYIPSESMEPGLVENDRILVQKPSYWFGGGPQRGDVVVFADPGGWLSGADNAGPTGLRKLMSKVGLYPTGGHLVKRVIGTEGDVVECCDKQGRIKINGQPMDEPYLGPDPGICNGEIKEPFRTGQGSGVRRPCQWTIGPIPSGKLFMLGDNRGHSSDSRFHICGPNEDPCTDSPWVDSELVVGKVFTLIWPIDRLDWITRPDIFDDVPDAPPADLLDRAEKLEP